jgi:hypothetical protein
MTKDIRKPGYRYSDKDRVQACIEFNVTGSMASVSRSMGISEALLSKWRHQDWFIEQSEALLSEKSMDHVHQYNALTAKALSLADAGLDAMVGDKLTANDIKSLVVTGATATDKSRLLRNQATSIRGNDASVTELAQQFAVLSRQQQEIRENQSRIENSVVSTEEPLD